MKQLTASQLTKDALMMLRAKNYFVWRQQNSSYGNRRNIATKGVPDILGFDGSGKIVCCEVKTLNDRLSEEQREFLSKVKDSGGLALIANQSQGSTVINEFKK